MGQQLTLSLFVVALGMGSALAAQPVPVATLADISGNVMVDSGNGFVPAQNGGALAAGDRVLVGRNSSAQIAYSAAATCTYALKTRGVVNVSAECPASESGVVGSVTQKNQKKTVGSAPVITGGSAAATPAAAATGLVAGLPAGAIAAGVVGTVALGTVIAVAASDSGGSPASPRSTN